MMRILIDSDNSDCGNLGDLAMLQVAVARLKKLFPGAELYCISGAPEELAHHCPDVVPVPSASRQIWLADRYLLEPLHRWLPPRVTAMLGAVKRGTGRVSPGLLEAAIGCRRAVATALGKSPTPDPRPFLEAVAGADLVVVTGLGGLADTARRHSLLVLETLRMACEAGIPTTMLSQGIGPLTDRSLVARARRVLPRVGLIAVREPRAAPTLLESWRVPRQRIVLTGDDAVGLAYDARPAELGEAIGVNLRVAKYAEVGREWIAELRSPLHQAADQLGVPLVSVPIKTHRYAPDAATIRELLTGRAGCEDDGSARVSGPLEVIQQAGRCRCVVTSAYHAAVFALAQGIPAVCLARSQYYLDKFLGLQELFGAGCDVLWLDGAGAGERVGAAIHTAWATAAERRPGLLAAAARQVEWGEAFYQMIPGIAA